MRWYPLFVSVTAVLVCLAAPMRTCAVGTQAGTQIHLYAEASCPVGAPPLANASAVLTVLQVAAATVYAGSPPSTVVPGQTYFVSLTVRNRGNATDAFALSASSANGWGVSFVHDENRDGVHQASEVIQITSTGALRADTHGRCFLRLTVPPGATKGDTVTVIATSAFSPTTPTAGAMLTLPAPAGHTVGFASAPAVSPTAVDPPGTAQCSASAEDSQGHAVTYAWSDGGAGGTFSPSASSQNPTYTAKANATGSDQIVTLVCTAACSQSPAVKANGTTSLTVRSEPAPAVQSVSPADSATGVAPSASLIISFSKPMDHSATEAALECSPALVSPIYAWSSDSRTLTVRHDGLQTGKGYACTVSVFAVDTSGMELPSEFTWSFTTASDFAMTVPGDLSGNGLIGSEDLALFSQEWLRWHADATNYDPAIDARFDLAPRTNGVWPNWWPLPNGTIDIRDATAFTECWLGSGNATLYYSSDAKTYSTNERIYVSVSWAPYKVFAVDVALPGDTTIDPSTDAYGNLRCVQTMPGVTVPFFSEYDAITHSVRMTGALTSTGGQFVAAIQLW